MIRRVINALVPILNCCRLKMFSFWNEDSRLSSDTLPRLTQLLPVLYSESSERHFLHHSTNLLLELTSRSPDFNRSMFDSPLSECKFEVTMKVCFLLNKNVLNVKKVVCLINYFFLVVSM